MFFETLPVDLIAELLSALDLESLIQMAYVSKRFYLVASDPSLNPWRRPIMRNLHTHTYDSALKHLSARITVPRQNWVEILSLARPSFILFEATLPNLKASDWEECFKRRFLPGWEKWRKESSWKEAFLKVLYRVWHRSTTSCTTDESWTKYIVLNRNGSANELEVSSRNYNPLVILNEMKVAKQSYASRKSDQAFGTLMKPRSDFTVNPNAHILLNPPGIPGDKVENLLFRLASRNNSTHLIDDHGVYPMSNSVVPSFLFREYRSPSVTYTQLRYPRPASSHENYPYYTDGGGDLRWIDSDEIEHNGVHWVGGMLLTAQILSPSTESAMYGRQQYASFGWQDFWAIAPWMEDVITKRIDGAGLGN